MNRHHADWRFARAGRVRSDMSLRLLFSGLARGMPNAVQRARRGRAVWLLPLILMTGCATLTGQQQATTDASAGIAVVPLADGATRVDVSTDVAFDYGGAVLRPAVAAQLVRALEPYKQRHLQVSAYTDNVGAPAFNLELSQRRAQAVADVLLDQGFSTAQLAVNGYGEGSPVASNATEAGRRLNRRIEILITDTPLPDG